MVLGNNLDDLDTKVLQGMPLKELEVQIRESLVANITRSDIFSVLMKWLNEQIKQDGITQSGHLLEGFVSLLRMNNHADIEPFKLAHIDEAFNEWLEKDAVQNPAYRRRAYGHPLRLLTNEGGRDRSPALSCEQGVNYEGSERRNIDKRRETNHGTLLCASQWSDSPTEAEIIKDGKLSQFIELTNTDAGFSQYLKSPDSQGTNTDDVITTQDIIVTDSSSLDAKMWRASTRKGHRGHKHKVYDVGQGVSSPPDNYICRRCLKPGHWIQHCPTNLDPSYDRAPSYDYRCNFCGQKGDHFATLCWKNLHEGSLAKQHSISTTIKTKNHQRFVLGTGIDLVAQNNATGTAINLAVQNFVTPKKVELVHTVFGLETRIAGISHDNMDERQPSSGSRNGPVRSKRRSDTPSPLRRCRSSFVTKTWYQHRDLDKTVGTDEGRLAYDDESDAPKSSPRLPTSEEEVSGSVSDSVMLASELLDAAKDETEEFLRALAAEIISEDEGISRSIAVDTNEVESRVDGNMAIKAEPRIMHTSSNTMYRLVQCPPFSPEIVSLFHTRENPIVNSKTDRKTASQFWPRRNEQADAVTTVHPPLPHR
ncbi:hypothetical protein NUW58_g3992 [Xylaria curta]|uniref:Uncharacterized protein n=1 Tax=Xylaria curta TaxID=42375 RepID=A0ACC1PBE4_9PEZI|nr:hypothetical protein NUW58_g3992 [Xylaria curta]